MTGGLLYFIIVWLLIVTSKTVLGFQHHSLHGLRRIKPTVVHRFAARENELSRMEQEVKGSVQAQMDLKRVAEALDSDQLDTEQNSTNPANLASRWQIALASAIFCSVVSFSLLNNSITTGIVFIGTFILAARDPLEEEGAAGAGARLLGRFAINSVEVSKPKIKAVARAAMTNEEDISRLKQQVSELQEENATLRLWKERRIKIDETMSDYTLDELKAIARENRLAVGGTKAILMMRLLEANAIKV